MSLLRLESLFFDGKFSALIKFLWNLMLRSLIVHSSTLACDLNHASKMIFSLGFTYWKSFSSFLVTFTFWLEP